MKYYADNLGQIAAAFEERANAEWKIHDKEVLLKKREIAAARAQTWVAAAEWLRSTEIKQGE